MSDCTYTYTPIYTKAMTTLIYPESELEVHIAPPKGLQQLLHNPLAALSQLWHSSNFSLAEEEREELPLVQLTGHQQPASPLRLHVNAERCLSSLRAGTASIAIMQDDTNGVNFLDLPVSPIKLGWIIRPLFAVC